MARTRSFDEARTTAAAMNQFWEHGYADTSLADLERCTGLNRSSIYQFYGSKRLLFDAAIALYLREVLAPRLTVLTGPGPGLDRIQNYFEHLGQTLEELPPDLMKRGCLVINSATEMAGHDFEVRQVAQEYRNQLGAAFSGALSESHLMSPDILHRSDILVAGVIGILVTSRFDLPLASRTAAALAAQVHSWQH